MTLAPDWVLESVSRRVDAPAWVVPFDSFRLGLVTPAVEPPASSAWCHTDCSHPLLVSRQGAAALDPI